MSKKRLSRRYVRKIQKQIINHFHEDITDLIPAVSGTEINNTTSKNNILELKEFIDTILQKNEELKEFEKELKKHKDKLTPGQVGES